MLTRAGCTYESYTCNNKKETKILKDIHHFYKTLYRNNVNY